MLKIGYFFSYDTFLWLKMGKYKNGQVLVSVNVCILKLMLIKTCVIFVLVWFFYFHTTFFDFGPAFKVDIQQIVKDVLDF